MSLAEKIAKAAESQIGVREESENSGKMIRTFQKSTWLEPGEWPWCAAFVCWAIQHSMVGGVWTFDRPQTAAAWKLEDWCRSVDNSAILHKPHRNSVKRGDVIIYKFSHVGIAVSNLNTSLKVDVIEGNTNDEGSREGDGVYLKHRHLSKIRSIIRFTV